MTINQTDTIKDYLNFMLNFPGADSDHRDARAEKTFQRRMTVKPRDAAEAMKDGIRHARTLSGPIR